VRRVILNERDRCAEWARQRIPHVPSWGEWCEAIGLEEDGELLAVVVFNFMSECDIAMHVAAIPGRRWLNREFLRVAFRYPFVQLKLQRVTGYVPEKNVDALRFDSHLGFQREGLMRRALPDDNVVVLGMLREECRWL
jgi:RimJ/RimL family protein N-acetyltransferase